MPEHGKSIFYEANPLNQKGFICNITTMYHEPYPMHVHDVAEFVHLTGGQAVFTIDGETYSMKAGDHAAIFPLVPHQYVSFSEDARGIAVFMVGNAIAEYQTLLNGMRPCCPVIGMDQLADDAGYVVNRLIEYTAHEEPGFALAYIHLYLSHLFAVMPMQPMTTCTDKGLAVRVIEYITSHYQEPLQLQNTAEALGISTSHLSHLMSQQLGIGFRQYINTMRVNHAKKLITETQMSMSDISVECGYTTQRSFNRAFLEAAGITPGAYRAERLKRHMNNAVEQASGD